MKASNRGTVNADCLLDEFDVFAAHDDPVAAVARRPDDIGPVVQSIPGAIDIAIGQAWGMEKVEIDNQFRRYMGGTGTGA